MLHGFSYYTSIGYIAGYQAKLFECVLFCYRLLSFSNQNVRSLALFRAKGDDIVIMSQNRMKLSQFAKNQGMAYITAYRHWQSGNIEGMQLPGGTILVSGWADRAPQTEAKELAIVYSRVSSNNQKLRLKNQTASLVNFAHGQGYEVIETIEEVGTGFSDKRTKLLSILHRTDWSVLIVEDMGALMKFGFPYLEVVLKQSGREIVLMNDVLDTEPKLGEIIEMNGELELLVFMKRTRDLMRSLIGVGGQKAALERSMDQLSD